MNENTPTVTLPLGYVAIPLDEYKIMVDKICRFNADMADEIKAATERVTAENKRLREMYKNQDDSINNLKANITRLQSELEYTKKRNDDLTDMAHTLNETVYSLKKEIAELNDELLATDTVCEIRAERPAEEYHECCHAVHQEG